MPARISSELGSRIHGIGGEELVDVVVELRRPEEPPIEASRDERIRALKEAFDQQAPEIERAVVAEGGVILDRAWINQTVKAKVPAGSISALAARDDITAIDVPHALEPDQE